MKIIEVSSEAGHKIGGIYTVLRSKTGEILKRFGEDYLLVGNYEQDSAKIELKKDEPDKKLKQVLDYLEKMGIKAHYGRWTKGNNARLLLLNPYTFLNKIEKNDKRINKIKYALWEKYGINSLTAPYDFDKNVGWAWCAGMFLEKYSEVENEKIIAHFHEWMAGAGVLYLKEKKSRVKTIFTTHATTLGRSMASFDKDFTEKVLKSYGTVSESKEKEYNVEAKHLLEKACAHNSDIFTTVSEITAKECEYILGKKPDIITENGVDFEKFPKKTDEEMMEARKNLFKFMFAMFPNSEIKRDTAITYLSGRYEYTNKGIDLYLKMLSEINKKKDRSVCAFIFVPTDVKGPREEIMENVIITDKIFDNIDKYLRDKRDEFLLKDIKRIKKQDEFLEGMFYKILELIQSEKIKESSHYESPLIKGCFELFKNMNQIEGISAFNMPNQDDTILNEARELGLDNSPDDRVKVVFYGTYVKEGDGLINMDYYSTILGCDMGIFPSRYEPWGYTPVEAGAMKNIAFTTDFSGFGRFITGKFGNTSKNGIKVIEMHMKEDWQVLKQMNEYFSDSLKSMKKLKENAYSLAKEDNWTEMIEKYLNAYEMVLNGKK